MKYKCKECFDTGCSCGGIGVSCHGCCSCSKGEELRENRKQALNEICYLINIPKNSIID